MAFSISGKSSKVLLLVKKDFRDTIDYSSEFKKSNLQEVQSPNSERKRNLRGCKVHHVGLKEVRALHLGPRFFFPIPAVEWNG